MYSFINEESRVSLEIGHAAAGLVGFGS